MTTEKQLGKRELISATRTAKILDLIRRVGLPVTIFCFSSFLSVLSVSMASITHHITGDPIGYTGLINTAIIPFVLGVPTLIVLLSVMNQLEETREELARLSTIDVLTGTLNRRSLLERGQAACSAVNEDWQRVSLALIDADLFKNINDQFGHLVGDATLRSLANAIEDVLPQGCFCGRYGGEEFAIVMPGHGEQMALALAERLRAMVEERCQQIDDIDVGATISIGVAVSQQSQADIGELLAQADAALYAAKDKGRNQVCLADPAN